MTGWVKRPSTRTTTVLPSFCLPTTPSIVLARLARQRRRHAVDLEQDPTGLHPAHPEPRRALARAHAHLERLLRHRQIRIDPDPHPARALHVAGQSTPRRLDLAGGDALRLQ